MTQAALAELYQTSSQNITMHIRNIYNEEELEKDSTCKFDLQVQIEGNREIKRTVKFYNLEMIISIGFRVKSSVGNIFRKWANQTLKEYMTKGFAMDDERLKDSSRFGKDYFDELLLRIRAIRASEKRFYQKVLEIYATSIDYNSKDERSIEFVKDWGEVTSTYFDNAKNYLLKYGDKEYKAIQISYFVDENIYVECYLDEKLETLLWRRFDKDRPSSEIRMINNITYGYFYESITDLLR